MDAGATHQTALTAYKQHKFADAVTQFSEALKTEDPGSAEYAESVLLLGQSLYLQSKYADAIPWLEKGRSANPGIAAYHAWTASASALKGDTGRAGSGIGLSSATGRPWCVMTTPSPFKARSMSSGSRFFASATLSRSAP